MSTRRVRTISLIVMSSAGLIEMLLGLGLFWAYIAFFATLGLKDRQTIQTVATFMAICFVLLAVGLVVRFKHHYIGLSIIVVVFATILGTLLVTAFVDIHNLWPALHAGEIKTIRSFIVICVALLVCGIVGWFKHVRRIFIDDSRIQI